MAKRIIQPYEAGIVRLRLLAETDLPMTLQWRNQDHIRRWFFYSDLITPEQHSKWFEQYIERDDDFVFIIEDVENQYMPVGQVAIYHVDWENRKAEFGRLMIGATQATGKGLASAATRAALQLAFDLMRLKGIFLEVYAENAKAIRIYTNLGFQQSKSLGPIITMSLTPDSFLPVKSA
jgi:RimJ/RimL family protein N-acetyltransferase